ncbi:tRNA uridine-5-carboxymethylaminomethyl(34) synthesis GTPase MnmE [Candidatus Pantoea edessiphila]|uniref:tRNA modification GTPase MnmE n=1 Tax=Candidatus Pantoea edessiphila TaxID=2044610 RepID=A0A2P5SXB0_9GAMM|nr:tRNA uridine-5-carboxymethylaminomethyl(34) synthesis GTPase MnmE [Candidatus Pantoea edessiphila]MBK4775834.1 tRNA uridine-5-carboxymethylaminomethyl(34) synthesis GTPase MnmE [Pantoea sp. Edef]PPI86977.1 tRNA uridine-5-carboxymethylaminomethyl(34) synthesis GTPase MnmE [Candidatus Pantoea edessiphila]
MQSDTIVAQATPIGRGSIGILRVSGIKALEIAKKVLRKVPKPRYADYLPFNDFNGIILDKGIALWFPSPHSFTGEDVLELHCHGGPIILDLLLKCIISLPKVRIANPGEFSERAFLNEKIDLTQAEAISDLINASSEQAARSAVNSLQGMFSKRISKITEDLVNLRIFIETAIDFPNEEVDFISKNDLSKKMGSIIYNLKQLILQSHQGCLLNEGMTIVIAGYPNAGKSSLFNSLIKKETAIVTNIAGTTRDVLHEYINIDGIPLRILDTAGLRDSQNEIEYLGIKRAVCEIEKADHVLFIVDGKHVTPKQSIEMLSKFLSDLSIKVPVTIVRNKSDITGESIGITKINGFTVVHLSALNNDGMQYLLKHLRKTIGFKNTVEGNFVARRRHLQSLEIAYNYLIKSNEALLINYYNEEFIAEYLQLAQKELNKITGSFTSEDLLNKIFSSFCIGK